MPILANVMIPTVAEHVVVMLVLLLPVALIEAVVLGRRHLLKFAEALTLSFQANLRSTLVGLPLGYLFAWLGIIPAGLFASLLPKHILSPISAVLMNVVGHGGMIPNKFDSLAYFLGTLIVMVPYYLVTLRVERKVIINRRADLDTPALSVTVRLMNGITYALLSLPIVIGAICAGMNLASK